MIQYFKEIFGVAIIILVIMVQNGDALIGPIRVLSSGNVLLVPSDEIKLTEEHIELYHHPLGIWLVEYRALLKNLRYHKIVQPVGFPSGYDMRTIEGNLHSDRFENFKIIIDDKDIGNVDFLITCSNYVETTGMQWSVEDVTGTGFLNIWEVAFEPDEEKWITISFSFIVKKSPPIFNPDIQDSWYSDLINWIHQDYENRNENHVKLPLNIGSFWAFYPDSITIRTYVADNWFKVIDKSDRNYPKESITKFEYSEPVGFYSPPDVTLDTLTVESIDTMSSTQLILLKNSFVAKYGKIFKNEIVQKFFDAQPWYHKNPEFNNWYLTQWDIENIKLIDEYQNRLKEASR